MPTISANTTQTITLAASTLMRGIGAAVLSWGTPLQTVTHTAGDEWHLGPFTAAQAVSIHAQSLLTYSTQAVSDDDPVDKLGLKFDGGLTAAQVQAVQAMVDGRTITVGEGGQYANLEEACGRAGDLSPTADNWARVLVMPNSILTLAAEVEVPEYCEVIGVSRRTSRIVGSGNSNIRYRKWNLFRNFRYDYSGVGSNSGGFRDSTSIGAGVRDKSTVDFENLDINVTANQRPAIVSKAAELVSVKGCRILTSGIGIEILSGYNMHLRDSEIYLTNVNTDNPHYGIRHMSGRLTIWGSKITCGYGPLGTTVGGIEGETDQHIVGIYSGATGSSRVDIFGLWSIIRNEDGANPGVKCACLWNDSAFNTMRVWSGYLQAENGDNSSDGDNYEILNSATPSGGLGLVQISPSVRARRIGGPVYHTGPGIGMPGTISANTTLGIGRGGLYRINASAGAVVVTLGTPGTGYTPNITHGERYIFKRMEGANTITIAAAGSGVTIDGAASVTVDTAVYSRVEIVWCADSNMWLVV